jgi:hypothetical protein
LQALGEHLVASAACKTFALAQLLMLRLMLRLLLLLRLAFRSLDVQQGFISSPSVWLLT